MEILVVVLVVAAIAAAAFVVLQRRPGGVATLRRPRESAPTISTRRPGPTADPMTAAVVDHAQVTDPAEVPAAERRLRAQAQQAAAPLQARAGRAEQQRAVDANGTFVPDPVATYVDPADPHVEPVEPVEPGYVDPMDRVYGDRYDPRYDGRR
jgi:hypothetical protein